MSDYPGGARGRDVELNPECTCVVHHNAFIKTEQCNVCKVEGEF